MSILAKYTIEADEDVELGALRVCVQALDLLDVSAQKRAVRWLSEYHGVYVVAIPSRAEEEVGIPYGHHGSGCGCAWCQSAREDEK